MNVPMELYLFHFTQMKGIFVVRSELHEAHIGALRQLRDAPDAGKESARVPRKTSQDTTNFLWGLDSSGIRQI